MVVPSRGDLAFPPIKCCFSLFSTSVCVTCLSKYIFLYVAYCVPSDNDPSNVPLMTNDDDDDDGDDNDVTASVINTKYYIKSCRNFCLICCCTNAFDV